MGLLKKIVLYFLVKIPKLNIKSCWSSKKRKKTKEKINKLIKTGNNSTYHEPLSEEWIKRRS